LYEFSPEVVTIAESQKFSAGNGHQWGCRLAPQPMLVHSLEKNLDLFGVLILVAMQDVRGAICGDFTVHQDLHREVRSLDHDRV